jgi:TolB-like protein/DNA-binding winged helix-turn-helix (wHTH) protein/Tfp pilus assembly protein PilF
MRVAFGEYQLDTETRTLQREGKRIPVQSKAFDLLAYLIERRERVVSSNELLDDLWPGLHVTPAALSTAVQKARQAVGDDGEHQAVLHTEHGKGFRFVAEVTDLSPPETTRSGSAGAVPMSLIAELKRRNVFRVAAAYGIVAWLLVEVASVVLPTFEAPDWVMKVFTFLLILGFPIALIFAWAFELTPEGLKREKDVEAAESITHTTGRKLDFAIIGLLVIAIIYFALDKFVLEQARITAESAPAAELVARDKSIAVLLFDNLSGNAANEAFTKGIHDDILTQISKISALKVIARTSVERLDPTLNIREIGAQLGVAAVLEGGVQRAEDRVRINVQLIDCQTEAHLWAETYDRELTAANIFSIQSDVAKTVADALRATLSPEEQDRLATVPTENLAAYEAYLLGKQRFARMTSVALAEAVDYFQQAIDLDPNFALAHVELANSYTFQAGWFGLPRDQAVAKAKVLIKRALELDGRLGEAYAALANMQDWNDFENSQEKFRRALELNPNSATTYFFYGNLMRLSGRLEQALTLHRKGVELDPLSAVMINQVGQDLDALGRFDEGLSWYERSFDVDPGYPLNLWTIGLHHWLISGEYGEAARWLRKGLIADPGDPFSSAHLGRFFMDLGDPNQAEKWIHRSIELSPESLGANQSMILLHLYRGDPASGLEYGRKAFALGQSWTLQVYPVELLGDHELRAGRYTEALALYEKIHPELLNEDEPRVHNRNYRVAIDLASVFYKAGEQDRADLLLKLSFQHINALTRLGWDGYGIADVQIYALQGEKQKALAALRQAIDEGWRSFWWYSLRLDPTLETLHDEPEFQAMVAEIEADMAAQLARVREMEKNGELETIPEVSATTH